MRVGVVTNPVTKTNARRPGIAEDLRQVLGSRGVVEVPDGLDELAATVRMMRDDGVDVIALNGGDGTIHQTVTAMVHAWGDAPLPQLCLLRGGTNNTIARGVGARGRPLSILERLVSDPAAPRTRRTLLEVDGDRYGFMLSNGLFARYLRAYYEGEPSMLRAGWVLLRATASAVFGTAFARHLTAPMPVRVELDGVTWPDRGFMAVPAATVDDIGLGFRAFPLAPANLGRLQVLGLGCSAFSLAFQLRHFYAGRPPTHPDVLTDLCEELVLRSDEPIDCMIDGDPYPGGQVVTCRAGPVVEFIVP